MKTFQDGDPLFGAMMHAIANLWPNGTAVLSGCAPTGSGSARQVTVAAGTVAINGAVVSVSQQTKTLDAASFDRYDLVSINTSGVAVVTKGTEERRVPVIPANTVPIAICLIETGQAALPTDRIYDTRMLVPHVVAGHLTLEGDLSLAGDLSLSGEIVSSGKTVVNESGKIEADGAFSILYPDSSRSSANLCAQNLTTYSTTSTSFVKLSTLTAAPTTLVSNAPHKVHLDWEFRSNAVGIGASTRVYVNDIWTGVVKSHSGSSYLAVTEDITIPPGGVISIWGAATSGYECYVRNVRAYAIRVIGVSPSVVSPTW